MMPQNTAARCAAQRKNITAAKRAGDPQELHHQSPRRQRPRIRKIFSRILQPDEVRFLLSVWKAGEVRVDACPDLAGSLVRRGWIERDCHSVWLTEQTLLLIAEGVE